MVIADFTSSFLNSENVADNEIIVIINKPEIEDKGDYVRTNMQVEVSGKKKVYSPSRESGMRMVKAWGAEMDNWVSHKLTIKHVLKQVKGKTETYIEAYPLI